MDSPNWAEKWTAYGTVAGAIFTLLLVIAAFCALRGWRNTLENERADECVSAIRDLSGTIGRCVSLKEGRPQDNFHFETELWDAWRRFDRAFAVAYRYHNKTLGKSTSADVKNKLYALASFLHKNWSDVKTDGMKVQREIDNLLERAQKKLELAAK
jgi:hypothetical protein